MMMAARSAGLNSASCSARARGRADSLKSEYVSRVFSRLRSDSIRQTSFGQRLSASRKAAPRQLYWSRLSMKDLFHHRDTEARRKRASYQVITLRLQPGLDAARQGTEI